MLYLAGRKFDKNGKLQQWWSQTSINNFVSESQCVEYQYGNYSVKEANMKVCKSTITKIKVSKKHLSGSESVHVYCVCSKSGK